MMASFSGQFKNLEPFLHPNNLELFFASNRKTEQTLAIEKFNIWKVERKSKKEEWGRPMKLNEHINTADANEFYPSVSSNGNLYFTATKNSETGKEDIYVSRLVDDEYTEAELLPEAINSDSCEFNAFISPAENMLIFSSFRREDGLGGGDLYVSHKKDGQWQPAKNMGQQINSKQLDYCPFYDAKTQTLYWTSNQSQLISIESKYRSFEQWYRLYTSGQNGLSKIYSIHYNP